MAPAKAAGSTRSTCPELSCCTASRCSRRSSARTLKPSCRWRRCKWTASGPLSSATPGSRRRECRNVGTGIALSSGSPSRRVPDEPLTPQNKVRDVLNRLGDKDPDVLLNHGYHLGELFLDVLSQYQTLPPP